MKLQFCIGDVQKYARVHFDFWKKQKQKSNHFPCFDFQMEKNIFGNWKIIRDSYEVYFVGVESLGQFRIAGTLFVDLKNSFSKYTLGNLVVSEDIATHEVDFFWSELKARFKETIIGPLNGHHYLGFSTPISLNGEVGFGTTGFDYGIVKLFKNKSIYRKYYSYEMSPTKESIHRMTEVSKALPLGFKIENFEIGIAKKQLDTMNELVKLCFTSHFDFKMMSNEAHFDLLKWSVFNLKYLSFLKYEDRYVGFLLAFPDFNQILNSKSSDLVNVVRLKMYGHRIHRARLVHIGIIPEFQQKGLIKYLRHSGIIDMINNGITTFESSYVDENNLNSQKNVESTGGRILNEFLLFKV